MENLSKLIKSKAGELDFDFCGIGPVTELTEEKKYIENWLDKGYHGEMLYMEKYLEIRANPNLFLPNAKSIIVVLLNYFPNKKNDILFKGYKMSKYAYGKDYHKIIKNKLLSVLEIISKINPDSHSKIFCDSAPIFEKAWAVKSGLGWIGKNTCLIVPKAGSFFFIGGIITDLVLEYDHPLTKYGCGTCTKCIDACPTNALVSPYNLDAKRCLSYLTIEYKNPFINFDSELLKNSIFGCDICQDVCPINKKFSKPTLVQEFNPNPLIFEKTKEEWKNLSKSEFKKLFKNTALERTGYDRLKRNINSVI